MKLSIVVIVLAAVAGLAAWLIVVNSPRHASVVGDSCTGAADEIAHFAPTAPPAPLPDEPFSRADGSAARFADYEGTPMVVNFWATWCAPCVREMPALQSLQAAVAGDGIEVLTISEDRGGGEVVRDFLAKHGLERLSLLTDPQGKVLRALGIGGLPTTLLVDAAGREVGRVIGIAEWDTPAVVAAVRACVKGAA